MGTTCTHAIHRCVNPYELIRKYHCESCDAVIMCACDEAFATEFLPHQISEGHDLHTGARIQVTGGFERAVCNTCRGIPEVAAPKAEMYGATSKIRRYYWREIYMETTRRFAAWCKEHGISMTLVAPREHAQIHDEIERQVIEELKRNHAIKPKYQYREKSQDQVLRDNRVELVNLGAEYRESDRRRALLLRGDRELSPEAFVEEHYRDLGFNVVHAESTPIHALFGTLMWLVVQGPDPNSQLVSFGDRSSVDDGVERPPIMTRLPIDFGKSGYIHRMREKIDEHFKLLGDTKADLLRAFDYWTYHSSGLRQYLWAHRGEDMAKARLLLSVVPAEKTRAILRYLVKGYWDRYLGWPDLFVYNGHGYFFAEVKSSSDRLSEDQKAWIEGNAREMGLPFKLVKIQRLNRKLWGGAERTG